jgi:RNAse (barnase) inhibitor barstar
MSQAQSLQMKLQKGGLIDSAVSQTEALAAAQQAGMSAFIVDCDRARSRSAVLRAVVKAVDFPEYFGGNLDALYDCLCDTVLDNRNGLFLWFHRLHSGDPALEEDAKAIIEVCRDVAEFASNNERLFSFMVEHAGKHPDPEPGRAPRQYAAGDDE